MALDFSRNYSPPGVYIEESDSTMVTVAGIPPTLVALVGPAQGYQVNTEQARLSTEDPITLVKQGIDTNTIVVTRVSDGAEATASDYAVSANTADPTYTDITRPTTSGFVDNEMVFISYQYTDPTYYDPKRFQSFEDVKDVYGEPLKINPAVGGDYIGSPLSLGAMLAFQNGATDLVLVATKIDATDTTQKAALSRAYTKVNADPNITVISVVTSGIAEGDAGGVLTDFRAAINQSAQDGFYRFGVIGFDPDAIEAPDSLLNTAGAHDRRLMLAYAGPAGLRMYSGPGNTSFPVGHQFLAAAYAGRMARLPIQQALTKQVIAGFSGLAGTPLSNSLKNQYASAGIAVTEVDRFGRLSVRHGVTTDTTNVNTREASVVRAKDSLVTALNEGAATSGLIGAPLDGDTLMSVKSAVQGVLENAVSEEVIISYTGLTLRQLDTDPSVVEVKFAYKPAYPLNYIVISFSIDMSSGVTDLNTDETLV